MSPETVAFLLSVLDLLNLSAGSPDFAETATSIMKARAELEALRAGPTASQDSA